MDGSPKEHNREHNWLSISISVREMLANCMRLLVHALVKNNYAILHSIYSITTSILHFGILQCTCRQSNDQYTSSVQMIS